MLSDRNFKIDNSTESRETAIATDNGDRIFMISWLFLIGSLIFLVDGFLEITEGISVHALLHLSASFLFTIGSALFIPSKND